MLHVLRLTALASWLPAPARQRQLARARGPRTAHACADTNFDAARRDNSVTIITENQRFRFPKNPILGIAFFAPMTGRLLHFGLAEIERRHDAGGKLYNARTGPAEFDALYNLRHSQVGSPRLRGKDNLRGPRPALPRSRPAGRARRTPAPARKSGARIFGNRFCKSRFSRQGTRRIPDFLVAKNEAAESRKPFAMAREIRWPAAPPRGAKMRPNGRRRIAAGSMRGNPRRHSARLPYICYNIL